MLMDQPRCDYIPLWSTSSDGCPRRAKVLLLHRHNAGTPVYRARCLLHASRAFGPHLAAVWEDDSDEWHPLEQAIGG